MRHILLIITVLLLSVYPATSQNYKFGKVSKKEVLQKEHPENKDANAAILYRSQKVYYDFDKTLGFTLVNEVHERIKIYNKEGFDWATKEIRKYTGSSDEEKLTQLKGNTYNIIDGKLEEEKLGNDEIFEEEVSKYRMVTKFTMPAVTEGSVIEYTYKIKSPFLGSIGKTPLQSLIPIDRLELQVKIPEYFFFSKYQNLKSPLNLNLVESKQNSTYNYTSRSRSKGWVATSTSSSSSISYTLNVYELNRDNIPALKIEPYVDNLHNYAAFIDWELQFTKFPNSAVKNYSENWEGVAKSIYDDLGVGQEIGKDGFYDKDLDVLLSGLSDPMMKANKIYSYVKQKVRWNDYFGFLPEKGTRKAYKDGSGNTADINLLLISMLNYANLKAHPILVSTPSNGIPLFPTRDGFNYVIAGLELGGGIVFLDATDPTAAIGELPKRARNWQGRLLKDEGVSSWISLIPGSLAESTVKMNIKFDGQRLEGRSWKSYTGLSAKKFRVDHSSSEDNNGIKDRVKGMGEIDISAYELENKNIPGSEIIENFNFEIENGTEDIAGKIFLQPMLFDALLENPFKDDKRNYPIFYDFPEQKNYTFNIMIPEGYEISSVPESIIVSLGENDGEFKFIVNANGKIIRLLSHVRINKLAFQPEEYEGLKKFYANIIKKQGEAIVLEKTIEDGFSERAESGR